MKTVIVIDSKLFMVMVTMNNDSGDSDDYCDYILIIMINGSGKFDESNNKIKLIKI